MKKFDWKLLFALLMVVVLVFALAACNTAQSDDEDDDSSASVKKKITTESIETDTFFSEMESALSGIGKTAVDSTKDIEISCGFTFEYALGDALSSSTEVDFRIILDRTSTGAAAGQNTSVYLSVLNDGEKLSLGYFLADPKKIYVDMGDSKQYVAFDLGINDTFACAVDGVLNNYDLGFGFSFMELLNTATATFGAEFTIGDLMNAVVSLVDFNALLGGEDGEDLDPMIQSALDGLLAGGADGSSLFDTISMLGGIIIDSNSVTVTSDGLVYRAELSKLLIGMLSRYVDASALINTSNSYGIGFVKKTSEIGAPAKEFFFDATLNGYGENGEDSVRFRCAVDNVFFGNVDGAEAKDLFGVTGDYQSFAIGGNLDLKLPDGLIKLSVPSEYNGGTPLSEYDLSGEYSLTFEGALNLDDLTKTALDCALVKDDKKIAVVTYADKTGGEGVLKIKFDKTEPVGRILASLFAENFFEEDDALLDVFLLSGEYQISGINLKSALPVYTGDGAETSDGEGEGLGELDELRDALFFVEPDIFSGKGFFNYLLENLSVKNGKTTLTLDTLGDAFLAMFTSEKYTTVRGFAEYVYALEFDLDDENIQLKTLIDSVQGILKGSAFVDPNGNGAKTLENLFDVSVVITSEGDSASATLTCGDLVATLVLEAYVPSSVIPEEPVLSEGAAKETAPYPLVEWGDFLS